MRKYFSDLSNGDKFLFDDCIYVKIDPPFLARGIQKINCYCDEGMCGNRLQNFFYFYDEEVEVVEIYNKLGNSL